MTKPNTIPIIKEKFWNFVKKTDSCWIWNGMVREKTKGRDYGVIKMKGERKCAHRIAWILHNGPIPNKLCVLHKCDTPRCVRPSHLWLGTKKDNSVDRDLKGRTNRPQGVKHPHAIFKNKDILLIREKHKTGKFNCGQLGRVFNASPETIRGIVKRLSWRHL